MLSERTIIIAETYWADYLGCTAADLNSPVPLVIPHGDELADYHGLFAFFRHTVPVISVPANDHAAFTSFFDRELAGDARSPSSFLNAVKRLNGTIIGPAFIGYTDTIPLGPPDSDIRRLGPGDEPAVEELISSCPSLDWEHGGSIVGEQPTVGAFVGNRLVALAGYEIWGESIAHIAVITDPEFRGRGFGRRAVAGIVQVALAATLIPQYRTLQSNLQSMRIASRLGFEALGVSVAVRLPE